MNDMQPLKYSIYKGVSGKYGAVQFNYIKPHFYCSKDRKHKFFEGKTVKEASFKRDTPCPRENCQGTLSSREGCILLDITSAVGRNKYDWDNKIIMQLTVTDIGQLMIGFLSGKETKLMHDPGAKTANQGKVYKNLIWSSPNGPSEGGILTVTHMTDKNKETMVKHRVPLSPGELQILVSLLRGTIPNLLAWSN
jgi:hypothetical protein